MNSYPYCFWKIVFIIKVVTTLLSAALNAWKEFRRNSDVQRDEGSAPKSKPFALLYTTVVVQERVPFRTPFIEKWIPTLDRSIPV